MQLVTIVVPIYNAEKYLNDCLYSISVQTYSEIEVILINDGSTDESGKISQDWCDKDKRFIYLEQDNQGQGVARNRAIAVAKGSFVTFIDSDDWVDKDYIKELYETLGNEHADFCTCGWRFYDDKEMKEGEPMYDNYRDFSDINSFRMPNLARRLYRMDLFKENHIYMPVTPYEDMATFPVIACLATKTAYLEKPYYYYRINTGKSTMDNIEKVRYYPAAMAYMINLFKGVGMFEEKKAMLLSVSLFHFREVLMKYKSIYEQKKYTELKDIFRKFLDCNFEGWDRKYWMWGSLNIRETISNLKLESNLVEDIEHTFFGQTSIVSLMSDYSNIIARNKEGISNTLLQRSLYREFRYINSSERDYLVIDFLEERYNLLRIGCSYETSSEVLENSDFLCETRPVIEFMSVEHFEIWKKYCLNFMNILREKFGARVILIKTFMSERVVPCDTSEQIDTQEIHEVNLNLKKYYDFFVENYPEAEVIEVPERYQYKDRYFYFGTSLSYMNDRAFLWASEEILNRIYN